MPATLSALLEMSGSWPPPSWRGRWPDRAPRGVFRTEVRDGQTIELIKFMGEVDRMDKPVIAGREFADSRCL
jgi:hypothetical protein